MRGTPRRRRHRTIQPINIDSRFDSLKCSIITRFDWLIIGFLIICKRAVDVTLSSWAHALGLAELLMPLG